MTYHDALDRHLTDAPDPVWAGPDDSIIWAEVESAIADGMCVYGPVYIDADEELACVLMGEPGEVPDAVWWSVDDDTWADRPTLVWTPCRAPEGV